MSRPAVSIAPSTTPLFAVNLNVCVNYSLWSRSHASSGFVMVGMASGAKRPLKRLQVIRETLLFKRWSALAVVMPHPKAVRKGQLLELRLPADGTILHALRGEHPVREPSLWRS